MIIIINRLPLMGSPLRTKMFCIPASRHALRINFNSSVFILVQVKCIRHSTPKYVWVYLAIAKVRSLVEPPKCQVLITSVRDIESQVRCVDMMLRYYLHPMWCQQILAAKRSCGPYVSINSVSNKNNNNRNQWETLCG